MERLTPGVQNTYPLDRRIMETVGEKDSVLLKRKNPEARVMGIVERAKKEQEKNPKDSRARVEAQKQKTSEKEPGFTPGGPAKGFAGFDPERFKENSHLEELAKMVRAAGRQGKIDKEFLEKIQNDLADRVRLGLVSDNWAQKFSSYFNEVVVSENLNEATDDVHELSQDVAALVTVRKERGLSAEEAQASRVVFENAFGRRLTDAEFQRIVGGNKLTENIASSNAFEKQIQLIEKIAGNPRRFEALIASTTKIDAESVRQVMSGKSGELVFGMLFDNVEDVEVYKKKLRNIIQGNVSEFQEKFIALVREVEQAEKKVIPKVDPEKVKLAYEAWAKKLEEIKKVRDVTADDIDAIRYLADRGRPPEIGGASDDHESHFHLLLETVNDLPDVDNQAFKKGRDEAIDIDFIDLLAAQIHDGDESRMVFEKSKFESLRELEPVIFKQRYREFIADLYRRAEKAKSNSDSAEQDREAQRLAAQMAATGEVKTKGGKTYNTVGLEEIEKSIVSKDAPDRRPLFQREPQNIREVAAWIMAGDDRSIWGPDGVYPIFTLSEDKDPETGIRKAEFQSQNLIRWIRNKALEHHGDNPNDPINLLNGIAIETLFKSVSILTMKYNKQKYFADENNKPLSNLADEVVNEAWLFGARRNKNLGYIQVMNSDEKLFDAIVELSGKNDHTSSTNLADLLQMGEDFDDKTGNKDNKAGDAMLAANQIYRNLADIEKLRKILPADSPIFTVEGFKSASRFINKLDFGEETDGSGNLHIEGNRVYFTDPKTKVRTEIFKSDGTLVSDKNLLKFLNFFPEANPQETQELFVRELVKQSVAKIIGFDTGVDKEEYEKFVGEHGDISFLEYRKLSRMNLEWAETNSWVEQRWNGAAARNDTGYRGYDAWTKMYVQYYRERQSGDRTAGPIGNPHDLQIFRMLTPDMWLAIRTESGESVQEIFEELHMTNLDLYKFKDNLTPEQEQEKKRLTEKKEDAYKRLRFPRWTESDWASNGVNRQAQVWHNIMNTEDLKFNELAKKDSWGILRYDRQKFEEVVKDDFIKKRRYAFSSNNAMNYGAVTRMRVRSKNSPDGSGFEYQDMYLAEAMFGGVVMDSIRQDWFDGKIAFESGNDEGIEVPKRAFGHEKKAEKEGEKDEVGATFQEYLNSNKARERILKNVCRAGLAAQIKAHRERTGTTERWDADVVRKMYKSLRSMPAYREDPATGEEMRVDGEQFFSEEDIEWIRKNSGTTRGRLLWEDTYHMAYDAAEEGLGDMFEIFYKDIVS